MIEFDDLVVAEHDDCRGVCWYKGETGGIMGLLYPTADHRGRMVYLRADEVVLWPVVFNEKRVDGLGLSVGDRILVKEWGAEQYPGRWRGRAGDSVSVEYEFPDVGLVILHNVWNLEILQPYKPEALAENSRVVPIADAGYEVE